MAFRLSGPSLALLIPVILYNVLACLHALAPGLFCVAVNSGGKEFICGRGYTHVVVSLIQLIGVVAWVIALLIGGLEVIQGKAKRPAAFAWLFSAALFLTLIALLITAPNNDTP